MQKDNVMKDKIISDLNALFKARAEFYAFFDAHIPKVGQTAVFDFAKASEVSAEEVYKRFYHYDYAIRKLLPSLYKAYEIDSEKDLSKDF